MQLRVIQEVAIIDRRSGRDRRSGEDRRREERPGAPRRALIRRVADRVPWEMRRDLEDWYKEFMLPEAVLGRLMKRLAASLASAFDVELDELAILLVKDQGQLLRFAYPVLLYMGRMNFFPVKTNSIAGQVLLTRTGRIDNDVSLVRHHYIYERVRGRERRPLEIQKMVTAPPAPPRRRGAWGDPGEPASAIAKSGASGLYPIRPVEAKGLMPGSGPVHPPGNAGRFLMACLEIRVSGGASEAVDETVAK